MANKKVSRRALFTSIMSLILCCAMLMGTTFAWFTDSVTSGNNKIQAGNLDVELYHSNKQVQDKAVDADTTLFDDVTYWEPGAVAYENFVVENKGNLALKYQLSINISKESVVNGHRLSEALRVAVVEGGFTGGREDAQQLENLESLESFVLSGALKGDAKSKVYGVVVYWEPTENDNNFNMKDAAKNEDGSAVEPLTLDLGVHLYATQEMHEYDSFGNDYDESASMKSAANDDGSAILTAASAPSADTNETTVEAPAGAFDSGAEVEIVIDSKNTLFNVSSEGAVVASLDVTLLVDGKERSEELTEGKVYTVKTYISKGLNGVQVSYTGTDGKDQPTFVSYDAETGLLVFTTNHFSEYAVFATACGYTGDTAYGTVQEAADAIASGTTVKVADSDKQNVLEALPADKQNEFKQENAAAKVGNSTYFLSFAEAMNHAVKTSGATVTLLADTTMDADNTITIPSGVITNLDLNNHTLSGVADGTGNREMFLVKGTLNVKNGTINMSVTQNQGWSAMSTIFDITAGGAVKVENATIKNLGGTDMNFAAHLNNWGTATLNVIDSTLEAGYIAVRVFNSGNDMNNVTIKDSVLNGKFCLWVHNYTLADFGTAEKVEDHKALLNFKIYDNGNTFNNTGKAPVLYGFTDAVYFDANGQLVASDAASLTAAMAEGGTVVLTADITDAPVATTAPYGNYYGIAQNGGVLDGNGKTLDFEVGLADDKGKCDNYGIMTSGGTIKNVTITGVFRGIMIMNPTEDVYIDNVTIGDDDVCYAINTGEGNGEHSLFVTNSTIMGWSSYGTAIKAVNFEGCTFAQGKYYPDVSGRLVKPYVDTVFENCEFNSKFYIDLSQLGKDGDSNVLNPSAKITLKNCTVNGVKLTAENWKDLIVSEDDCGEGRISIEAKDGSYMSAANILDYVVIE